MSKLNFLMEKKKKILILMASFAGGGAEKVMIDLLRRFDKTRYQVTVVVLWGYGPHLASVPADVELIKLFDRGPNFFDTRTRSWRFIHNPLWRNRLLKALGDRRFDVTISFMEGQTALLHSYIMDRATVNISWVHVDIYVSWWYRFLMSRRQERAIYEKMDAVVFVSDGVREAFRKAVGADVDLRVIYNIIDRDNIRSRAEEFSVEKQKFTIISVGRLQPEKCQYRILEVAAELKRRGKDFEVWLLGTGRLEEDLKQKAASLGVADCVKFLGFRSNPYPYLKAADIFLLTSDAEGYPTVVCEALCMGKPVISTRITGAEELLENGAGILTGKDPIEITDRVVELMDNHETLAKYAESSNRKGLTFSPDDVMRQIESLWEGKI